MPLGREHTDAEDLVIIMQEKRWLGVKELRCLKGKVGSCRILLGTEVSREGHCCRRSEEVAVVSDQNPWGPTRPQSMGLSRQEY